jgi:hypothetical protein
MSMMAVMAFSEMRAASRTWFPPLQDSLKPLAKLLFLL